MKKRKLLFEKEQKNIIYNQRELGDVKFGLIGKADKNACGAVAIYNIKKLLDIRVDFEKEYYGASKWGTTLGLGVFGTNPIFVDKMLKKLDFKFGKASLLDKDRIREIFGKSRFVILLYRWKGIFDMHYAVFKVEDDCIMGYNTIKTKYSDVNDMINKEQIKKVYRAWWVQKD